MSDVYCENCAYWQKKPNDLDGFGRCRRYAPRPITYILTDENMGEEYDVRWPEVSDWDFCGDFKERAE